MLRQTDEEIYGALKKEHDRQLSTLNLIPSENSVSSSVLEAMGSILTNKYSEGYSGKRYYGGNEFVDNIETTAIERAKKLFGTTHANVQPYSGSPANQAVCFALLDPGEKIMGMDIAHGGHLTHGASVNFSAKYYTSVPYPVGRDGFIDYDLIERKAREENPKLIFCGATAYSRIIDFKRFAEIAESVGAYQVADIAHIAGLVAGGVHPSPVGHADVVTTTTHKTLRGPRGAMILCNGNASEPLKAVERRKENIPTLVDRAVFPGLQGGPHNHTTAGIAVALGEALRPSFRDYARQIVRNARALADELTTLGFDIVTGGTDNHLILIDLTGKGITGKQAQTMLDETGITLNKNMVPYDTRKPFDPSGIRLGTPLVTTRGMKEGEMRHIAGMIAKVLDNPADGGMRTRVREEVRELCSGFPLFRE